MNQYPKRLIEVDLPIKRISAHARREKSIRHGHISTLHIWWARRPLAACRAVICASLWFDPADEKCPDSFRVAARDRMRSWGKEHRALMSSESFEAFEKANKDAKLYGDDVYLRGLLLDFIADFANWDNSTNEHYLETSRALTDAAHIANGGEPGTRPLVVDPFAGGGAIPLEALRVGADAFASDLNPVAVLLNKVVLEYIPKYGQRLADEVRKWGAWVKEEAEKELAEFYPKDPDGSTPIAYLWARTIVCEGPGCGAEVPMMKSLWLAKKANRSFALEAIPNQSEKRVYFDIVKNPRKVRDGSVKRGSATCAVCGFTTPVASVRRQMKTRSGGADDARLFCVVTTRRSEQGRFYRLPTLSDAEVSFKAKEELKRRIAANNGELSLVPGEPTPQGGGSGAGRAFSQRNYGMDTFADLFTSRQLLALTTLARLVREAGSKISERTDPSFADAVQSCLALAVDKTAQYGSSLCRWKASGQNLVDTFGRQALPIIWDFAESNIFGDASGDFGGIVEWIEDPLRTNVEFLQSTNGAVARMSATSHSMPDDSAKAFVTDPPYYDAIPYSDLSDFFYVWLKRTLPRSVANDFADNLTAKSDECIVDEVKGKDRAYFERTMGEAMGEGRRLLHPSGVGIVVFANKSTSGWEAQLQAMVEAGWTITGSWPIDTEMSSRLRAMDSAALASSVHLVCRPREDGDGRLTTEIGDWRDVLRELPLRIHEWMPRLDAEGVAGADAIFACLGPALEIFSRYSSVEKPSGEVVKLREYLEHVWAAVAKEALNMIFSGADTAGFEEDARLTAMWLWTLFSGASDEGQVTSDESEDEDESEESSGKKSKTSGYVLEYDAARKIAQGLGAHLEDLDSIVEVKGDKARLLPVGERARDLFGYEGSSATEGKKKKKTKAQAKLFTEMEDDEYETVFGVGGAPKSGETTLDRVHQTMLLFGAGRSEAVKRFLVDDGVGNDERFWRLANALSALYPTGSEEKRWVDGVLARKKGLGF